MGSFFPSLQRRYKLAPDRTKHDTPHARANVYEAARMARPSALPGASRQILPPRVANRGHQAFT